MENSRLMPSLTQGFCGFHHTLDSALATLYDLDVPPARVTVQMSGKGYPTRWIVEQDPPAGEPLDPSVHIRLSVAGLGYFHALPVGMWDKGGEAEPGTMELVELLDDPLQKAAHWVREGARIFDIERDNPTACSRWISLFGLLPEDWPTDLWYDLAILLPSLQGLAGKEHGIRFALQHLLQLPLQAIQNAASFSYLPEEDLTRLGDSYSRLGVDSVVGDRKEEVARLALVVGPVSLDTYYEFLDPQPRQLLDAVLRLITNCYQQHIVRWVVKDPEGAPRLGHGLWNSVLGINSYLGRKKPVEEAAEPLEVAVQ